MVKMPVVEIEIGNRLVHVPNVFKEHTQTANECRFILEIQKVLTDGELSEIMPNIVYETDTVLSVPVQVGPEREEEEAEEEAEDEMFEML